MDLQLIETGNGGDLVQKSRDLFVLEGLENMPYMALFGGNVAASTPARRLSGEQAFDWWGNSLIFPNDQSRQFNSLTERRLNDTPLTSSGRITIEQAVKDDLKFMREFADVAVSASIIDSDKLQISITVQEPGNLQGKEFVYIWDATKKELQQ